MFHFLESQPFLVLFGVVAMGMALGKVGVRGISLGSVVCIILVGLVTSIAAYRSAGVSLALPDVLKTVFFNLFIFAMGVKIGPQFFAGLEHDGWRLVIIGLTVAGLAPILSYACSQYFELPRGAMAGLLAGANNSSAAFGAAAAAVQSGAATLAPGVSPEQLAGNLSAAFALCYSVSQIEFVLLMKALPAIARLDAAGIAHEFLASMRGPHTAPLPTTAEARDWVDMSISVRAYRVPALAKAAITIGEVRDIAPRVSIERVRREERWLTLDPRTRLEPGDEIVLGAPLDAHVRAREVLGPEVPDVEARALSPLQTVDVVVSRGEAAGRSLRDLSGVLGPGLYPSAIFRVGEELPVSGATRLKPGDVIRVTGTETRLAELGRKVGHVVRATHASDVLTLALGLIVGAAIGAIPLPLFGVRVSLGAAGMLLAGIVFGWIKTRRPAIGGTISEGGRVLLETLGLNVFTAVLAINSGQAVYHVMTEGPVWALIISALLVSAIPPAIAWWIGRHVLQVNPALLMGAVAGARQNTTSMYVAQEATRSAVPGIGYPVPLAIATLALSVVAYFLALFL
jgi:putative transport protein